ncbi:MAG TPA: DNA-processing protein DprA [Thermoanaerobaculia bacterium]|nr:DNA-processing protein DprA [Thermoanaerobaculia bacterium]
MSHSRREILTALGACCEVPRAAACRLAAKLDAWERAGWRCDPKTAAGLGVPVEAIAAAAGLTRRAPGIVRRELARARELGGRIVTQEDAEFPAALRELELPPPCLWVRGTLPPEPGRTVAIVGSRRADPYGREAAELFARELAAAGLAVVSGFARGIDAAAHRGALEGGAAAGPACRTAAVLGSGLGVDYPRGHRRLGERIAAAGSLVSEFPCDLEPKAWHFPVRNRLIAAFAAAVLVVQAAPRSGSLITARIALDLGRDVLAVPGRIFEERSAGANALIADGAHPALRPRDVLELMGAGPLPAPVGAAGAQRSGALPSGLSGLRGRALGAMVPGEPASPAALAAAPGEPMARVLGVLLELELEGRLRREPGPAYVRRA